MTSTKTTLAAIHNAMRELNRELAPGSESEQWQAFVADTLRLYGISPWDDGADSIAIDPRSDFAEYWTAIAEQAYDYAANFGEVPESWSRYHDRALAELCAVEAE